MNDVTDVREIDSYARLGIPELGFRNYWYPVLLSGDLRSRPKAIKVLGEDIVVFRDAGKTFALRDRCAHRGARLSQGKCEFRGTGTITCPYHAWTYDGTTGQCVAALLDGPGPSVACQASVKAYPTREHANIIWIFVGDMEAVDLNDDIPGILADTKEWFSISVYDDYHCNWRALVDNFSFEFHAPYVHRKSPELFFQPILRFGQDVVTEEAEGKKGLFYRGVGGVNKAVYPGLGEFPRDWWRVLKPIGRGKPFDPATSKAATKYGFKSIKQVLLPGNSLVGRDSGEYWLLQSAVPLDANTTRLFNINIWKRSNLIREAVSRVGYYAWRRWAHDIIFSGQDKRILDQLVPGPEWLSKTDAGLNRWRRFSSKNARRPASVAITKIAATSEKE